MAHSTDSTGGYETHIEDLTWVSESFPALPEPLIGREFMLSSIEDYLKDRDVILLEGPEGYGKTTLLTQFVRRNSQQSINVFITASRSWYQPEAVKRDICNQIHWVLNGEELDNDIADTKEIDLPSLLARLIRRLNKQGRRGKPYYFIIDGLNEIPEKDQHAREEIFGVLPFEAAGIKVILTGSESIIPQHIKSKIRSQSIAIPKFGEKDTAEYLSDLVDDDDVLEEIHTTCRGIPGRLASVRRILKQGASAQSIFRLGAQEIDDLFEMEWQEVTSERDRHVLALVAHSDIEHNIEDIGRILDLSREKVVFCIDRLCFVKVDPRNERIQFVSDAFQRYAKKRLAILENEVQDWIVDDLMGALDSDRSLLNLPVKLHETGRYDDLIEYLSPDRFYRVLKRGQSLGLANQVADLAFEAANVNKNLGEVARFSLHKSAISELWGTHVKRSEVGALTALRDFEGALALADTALSDAERLQLLAIIARKQKEQGVPIDDSLMSQIRRLSEDVKTQDLSNAAEKIGADLVYVDPELALRLVERTVEAGTGEHSLDVAYLKLSFSEAMRSRDHASSDMSRTDALEDIQARIQDPKVRRLSSTVSLLLGDYSADKVIEEAKSLEKTGDKLFFLRKWTSSHQRSEDAGRVIEYALQQVIQNTDYAHDAGLLRELAKPLPYLNKESEIRKLIRVFDQQKETGDFLVEELVRLEVLLAQAESRIDFGAAENRLGKLYFDLGEVGDLAARTEGFARLVSAIPLRETPSDFEVGILEDAARDLESAVAELLASSADQINATRHVIQGLACNQPDKALGLAGRLNTEKRRDKGVLVFIDSLLDAPLREINVGDIFRALGQTESATVHNDVLTKIFDRLAAERKDVETAVQFAERLAGEVDNMINATDRCKVTIQAYELLSRATKEGGAASHTNVAEEYLKRARWAFEALDNDSSKIVVAFRGVSMLAETNRETALEFREYAEEIRAGITLDSDNSRSAFLFNLDLTIRAFRGLLAQKVDVSEDQSKIFDLLHKVSSIGDKILLLSDLAFAFFCSDRTEDGMRIVEEHLRPLLGRLPEADQALRYDMWAYAAPPLYLAANNLTLSNLEQLPRSYRGHALLNIANTIIRKVMPSEPFDSKPGYGPVLQPSEIHELLALMRCMEFDSFVYYTFEQVVEAILRDKRQRTYDRSFRVSVCADLRDIAESSFPHPQFIRHDGFLILAQADLLNLKDTFSDVGSQDWINLLEDARTISNEADRAFVLSKLVEKYPSKRSTDRQRRRQVLDEVENLIQELPTTTDRVDRLETMAQTAEKVDKNLARKYYREAFSLLYSERENVDTSTLKQMRRRLLSSAYRIDPEFASSLASLIDDDPAHEHELERNIQRLERRKRINTDSNLQSDKTDPEFPNVCWESLGALNADRLTPVRSARAKEILAKAREYSLEQAYPIQSFIIEGLVQSYKETDQANRILRPIFEATLENTHLIERLALRSAYKQDRAKRQAIRERAKRSFDVKAGGRAEALQAIREWLAENVSTRLVICDQYFGPDEIEALYMIQSVAPTCTIEILTSEHHHRKIGAINIEETYTESWREKYDQELPNVRIVVAGKQDETKLSPVHDRWWLSDQCGLRLGTSFNSLGRSQSSEIVFMDEGECTDKIEEVERYLTTRARNHDGTKISYKVANL